jgi:hypothetical protein
VLSRYHNGQWEPWARTDKHPSGTTDAKWTHVQSTMPRACFGDLATHIRCEIWNNDSDGFHELLGTVQTTLEDVIMEQQFDGSLRLPSFRVDRTRGQASFLLDTSKAVGDALRPTPMLAREPSERSKPTGKAPVLRIRCTLQSRRAKEVEQAAAAAAAATAQEGSDTSKHSGRGGGQTKLLADRKTREGDRGHGPMEGADRVRERRQPPVRQPQAYREDLAFLRELTRDEVVLQSDIKTIVDSGIRYLCEGVDGADASSHDRRHGLRYRHTSRSLADVGGNPAQLRGYTRSSPVPHRRRPRSLPPMESELSAQLADEENARVWKQGRDSTVAAIQAQQLRTRLHRETERLKMEMRRNRQGQAPKGSWKGRRPTFSRRVREGVS